MLGYGMTEPTDFELLSLATPYALDAVSAADSDEIDQRVAAAPAPISRAFVAEVRDVHETMAAVSATTVVNPPAALRASVMAMVTGPSAGRSGWRTTVVAAAAAIIVGLTAFGVGIALRPSVAPSVTDEVLSASDVRSVSSPLATGTATVLYSRERRAGVLVMNNVPPPQPGTVYQMWLVGPQGTTLAGTMEPADVSPSTTAVIPDLGDSTALGFSVATVPASPQPAGPMISEIPLG